MALMTDINAACYLVYYHILYQVDMLRAWNKIINLFMLWNSCSLLMQLQRTMKNKTKRARCSKNAESDKMDNMSLDVIFSFFNNNVSQNKSQISTKWTL